MAEPTRTRCECSSCDAVFWVEHELESDFYPIEKCPFCGDDLDFEEELILDYGEEDFEADV